MKSVTPSGSSFDPVSEKIRAVGVLIERRESAQAEQATAALLKAHPQRHDVHNLMGLVQVQLNKRTKAGPYFEAAVKAQPNNYAYLNNLGRLYLDLDLIELALPPLTRALSLNPRLVETLWAIGDYYRDRGMAEKGLPYLDKAVALDPNNLAVRNSRAESLQSLGRIAEAKVEYSAFLAFPTLKPMALDHLSQIDKPTTESPFFSEALSLLQSPATDDPARSRLHSAMAHFYENSGDFDQAFEHFEQANILQNARFDIEGFRRWVNNVIDAFTPEFFARRRHLGHSSELPVFVVGMPRSGTTLTEQIIANHPEAGGAGELLRLMRFSTHYGYSKNPQSFGERMDALGSRQALELAENFLDLLKFHAPGAKRVVDKLPHNFMRLGFIALLFPRARIIHCRRNPVDTCWSCFQNRLNETHAYSKDLKTLGLYYREYDRLMAHWRRVLPIEIYKSRYEELTASPEESVRKLLDHLGLSWDPACLDFHRTEATVLTISRQQVRQPIYGSSVERWRRYEKHLSPLIEALGDCMEKDPVARDRIHSSKGGTLSNHAPL